jgi:hypothetical protein
MAAPGRHAWASLPFRPAYSERSHSTPIGLTSALNAQTILRLALAICFTIFFVNFLMPSYALPMAVAGIVAANSGNI